MTRLFIAEKPSLGKAIAAQIPGAPKAARTHIQCGTTVVTWAFGHLYELAPPDAYLPDDIPLSSKGQKRWRLEDLPILPSSWQKLPKPSAKDQLTVIRGFLKSASEVVNAGDADREGQLLIDEILESLHWKGPTRRIWLSALDPESVTRALSGLRDNREYAPLCAAAEARARADWLVGMNLSRAYTLKSSGKGVVSIGRVQTPTLALVVRRDQEIAAFRPVTHYAPWVTFTHAQGAFRARWRPPAPDEESDTPPMITDKRIADAAAAKALADPRGRVTAFTAKAGREAPPLPLTLSALQAEASRRYGLSAQDTLNAAQSLYETHKVLSYPRTDCPYLPESHLATAARVREAVARTAPDLSEAARRAPRPDQKTRAWDDSKVTAHYGLSPTVVSVDWGRLTPAEQAVYLLASRAWLAQFYPDHTFRQSHALVACGGESWEAKGRVTQDAGWKALYSRDAARNEEDKEDSQDLPAMKPGDGVRATGADVREMVTKPPPRYTDGTLIAAMARVHQFVTDPKIKARLKETSGLGTEATRASILETLLARDFIRRQKKAVVSTERGQALIAALPHVLTDPGITGLWEDALQAVATGSLSRERFEEQQRAFVVKRVHEAKEGGPIKLPDAAPSPPKSSRPASGRRFAKAGASASRRAKGSRCAKET